MVLRRPPQRILYRVFGPERIARSIAACGVFCVELRESGYRMHLEEAESKNSGVWTREDRDETPCVAAEIWVRNFGALHIPVPDVDCPAATPRDRLSWAAKELICTVTEYYFRGDELGIIETLEEMGIALALYPPETRGDQSA